MRCRALVIGAAMALQGAGCFSLKSGDDRGADDAGQDALDAPSAEVGVAEAGSEGGVDAAEAGVDALDAGPDAMEAAVDSALADLADAPGPMDVADAAEAGPDVGADGPDARDGAAPSDAPEAGADVVDVVDAPPECPSGQSRCREMCVDTATNLAHCGACDRPCLPRAGAVTSCVAGRCVNECEAGAGDCDGNPSNGCEQRLNGNDNNHCGACGRSCPCAAGVCQIADIAVGALHACARLRDGTVRCLGNNTQGALGDGTTAVRNAPVSVSGIADAVEIAAGSYHTCARRASGAVVCWGDNRHGQLGDGTDDASGRRRCPVSGISTATQLSAARLEIHACALLADGTARCWGEGGNGALGDGANTHRSSPVAVSGLTTVSQISTGGLLSCAALTDGSGRCWGSPVLLGLTPSPSDRFGRTDLAAVYASSGDWLCARTRTGGALCAGSNTQGQLGDGTTTERAGLAAVTGLTSASELALGTYHACARLADNSVRCWGQWIGVGDGAAVDRNAPVEVPGLRALQVSIANSVSCARTTDGELRCWGARFRGDGGPRWNEPTPAVAAVPTDAVELALGGAHVCARLRDGTVRCWGLNGSGQLLGDGTQTHSLIPVVVTGLSGVVEVSAKNSHTCARLGDGTVRCWGLVLSDRGDGRTTYALLPVPVPGVSGATALSTSGYGGCALLGGGVARCWGGNEAGQLGDGSTVARTGPVTVTVATSIAQLVHGPQHTCARHSDGTVRCWGNNGSGQLGNGTSAASLSSVEVSGLRDAVEVSAGNNHVCALLRDGTVRCWGQNDYGQLGDGTTTRRTTPVAVVGLTGVSRIAVGTEHTCALLSAGGVRCWGRGGNGALGDGIEEDHVTSTPGAVAGLESADLLASGASFYYARLRDGTWRAWGAGTWGQLGNGTTAFALTPRTIRWP